MEYPQFEENLSSFLTGMQISTELNNLLNVFLPNSTQPKLIKLKEFNPADRMQLALPFELKIH